MNKQSALETEIHRKKKFAMEKSPFQAENDRIQGTSRLAINNSAIEKYFK